MRRWFAAFVFGLADRRNKSGEGITALQTKPPPDAPARPLAPVPPGRAFAARKASSSGPARGKRREASGLNFLWAWPLGRHHARRTAWHPLCTFPLTFLFLRGCPLPRSPPVRDGRHREPDVSLACPGAMTGRAADKKENRYFLLDARRGPHSNKEQLKKYRSLPRVAPCPTRRFRRPNT